MLPILEPVRIPSPVNSPKHRRSSIKTKKINFLVNTNSGSIIVWNIKVDYW
jgi:hypothetical protein